MALTRYSGTAPVAGSTVNVLLSGLQVLATLFEDLAGLVPLGNPFTADTFTGAYTFVAEQAAYDVQLWQSAAVPSTRVPLPPSVIFNGTSPTRTATLVIEDPDLDEEIVLVQVMY